MRADQLQPYAIFYGAMPTGVAVSHNRRVFVCFPRWGDNVQFTVGELRGGRLVAYPNQATNQLDSTLPQQRFVSVQSVIVDGANRLWALDAGSTNFGPVMPGGAKLVCYDLRNDQPVKVISFPSDVVLPTTYLNDVRIDLSRGTEGMAYITDSSLQGPNGLIVVDLATGKSWRRLNDHPSVRPDDGFVPQVEGQPLVLRHNGEQQPFRVGADGLALSADGSILFYTALTSRQLYMIETDLLDDPTRGEQEVAAGVVHLGDKGFASDGLAADAQHRVYLTDIENNAIRRLNPDGNYEMLVQDERMVWPDSVWLATDGHLYFIVNQLHRQAMFHGQDQRRQPYVLFRLRVDGEPILGR
jgi:sugar lactone lactonase YvrE